MTTEKEKPSIRSIALRVYTRYAKQRVYARVHVVGETHIAQNGKVELVLFQQRSRKVFGRRTIRNIGRGRMEEVFFDTGNIPSGCCAFEATFIDRHGIRFSTELLYDRSSGSVPWLGSSAGVDRKVPRPWTPLQTRAGADEITVECWDRSYAFGRNSFARQISAAGSTLLGNPIRPAARVNGKEARWQKGKLEIVAQEPAQTIFVQTFDAPQGVSVTARTEVDFDGVVRIDWGIASVKTVRLDGLALEVPLEAEHARYLYHFPGSWGEVRNVGSLPRKNLQLGFRPYIWLGDEERGLSWFAEADKNWFARDPKKVVEIRRQGKKVLLRINLVSVPVKLIPGRYAGSESTGCGEDRTPLSPGGVVTDLLRYSFGLQATPVKPVEKDAWEHRIFCISQNTPGFRPRLNVSGALLDTLVEKGVRAVVVFEHWTDAEGHTRTVHQAALKKIIRACHQRGLNVLLYFGFLISDIAPEWRDFGMNCIILPRGAVPQTQWTGQCTQLHLHDHAHPGLGNQLLGWRAVPGSRGKGRSGQVVAAGCIPGGIHGPSMGGTRRIPARWRRLHL